MLKEIRGKYLQGIKSAAFCANSNPWSKETRSGVPTQHFTTMHTTSIVITLLIVVPFFVFRTTITHVIVLVYPKLHYLIVLWA